MWALRRAANPLRKQGFNRDASQIWYPASELSKHYFEESPASFIGTVQITSPRSLSVKRFYNTGGDPPKSFVGIHCFSSQAGAKDSGGNDTDLEDGFSELESPTSAIHDNNVDNEHDELASESDISEDLEEPRDELHVLDTEVDDSEITIKKKGSPGLFKALQTAPISNVRKVLDKWVEGGQELTRLDISFTMLQLRKWRMYGKALQLSQWLESKKKLDFTDKDYASRLDLIAKLRGLQRAEAYIENIPESFRSEVVYRTLLANSVSLGDVKRSEAVFNKMKDLEFPITCFTCNQLLLLYKRHDKKKIADVLLLMEKENVKPSTFTYTTLIDAKGLSNDINGMDQIVEAMKSEGMEPDLYMKANIAKHYLSAGLKEKAEAMVKEMEGRNEKETRVACKSLLPLYATLGKADEVGRIWQVCEHNPGLEECMAAIKAWGSLNKIEEAEAVFERMSSRTTKLSSKHYSALLKVYVDHKLLDKGKDLMKRMANSGCSVGPLTWDALIKLHIEAGELEKADSILQKAAEQRKSRPMFASYMAVLGQYAKKGDIHNSEKIFHRMRLAGYNGRVRQFQSLVEAYVNAKTPAYGMPERMKADSIFPNKHLAGLLSLVNPFKKTTISELLD